MAAETVGLHLRGSTLIVGGQRIDGFDFVANPDDRLAGIAGREIQRLMDGAAKVHVRRVAAFFLDGNGRRRQSE